MTYVIKFLGQIFIAINVPNLTICSKMHIIIILDTQKLLVNNLEKIISAKKYSIP